MKVKLKHDQLYISIKGDIKGGKKGEIVEVDDTFLKLIKGRFEEVVAEKKEEQPAKPKETKTSTKNK